MKTATTPTIPDTFSEKQFLEEVMRFRELFGNRLFWAKPQAIRQQAVKGLCHIYFNLNVEGEKLKRLTGLMDSTLSEYTQRELLAIKYGMAGQE